jgi:hypothetical protein
MITILCNKHISCQWIEKLNQIFNLIGDETFKQVMNASELQSHFDKCMPFTHDILRKVMKCQQLEERENATYMLLSKISENLAV